MPTVDAKVKLRVKADLTGTLTRRYRSSGLRGRFNLVGNRVISQLFSTSRGLQLPKREQVILSARAPNVPVDPGEPTLTLDFVRHSHPFAWSRTGEPPLMTLDWVKHSHPFATADQTTVTSDKVRLNIRAGLSGQYRVFTPTSGTEVLANVLLNIRATFTGTIRSSNVFTLEIDAIQPTLPNPSKRNPKDCEVPHGIPDVTSNLPYDVWQENPDAHFYWNVIYACSRKDEHVQVPADGYYWTLTKTPATKGSWNWNFTQGNTAAALLSTVPPYGTGRWFFHVCAATGAGLGPIGTYIVRYNHRPRLPQPFNMWINGMDSLHACPFVAYKPPTPHLLSWTPFLDADSADVLKYDVEIGKVFDFSVDPVSHDVPVEATLVNLPTPTGTLTQTFDPGHHFWRIRATDGSQYSDWSPIGCFEVNTPPEKPTDLEVSSTVSVFSVKQF
jgi:hypothetical protein